MSTSHKPKRKNVVMASHGRAPWYGPDGKNVEAYVIGIAGGSASGKTSVARAILAALDHIPTVLILSQDSFYRKHTPEEIKLAFDNDLDLIIPTRSILHSLRRQCLSDLKAGRATEIPVYSFNHHQRMPEKKYLYGASVIIVEGIMALQSPEMRALYDLKVFVNCDSDLMLARRIKRDIIERGRDIDGILDQYLRFVKNSYDNFVFPSSRHADIIVPGSSNEVAIDLLVTHINKQLGTRSLRFRNMLSKIGEKEEKLEREHHSEAESGVFLLQQTNQLRGIMTILRDHHTSRGDFIFYADRLSTLIVEKALELIPHQSKKVTTPLNLQFEGVTQTDDVLVGVSILRSGGPFSYGLRRVIRDVQIGAMLIQSDPKTGEPLLLSSDLPQCVKCSEESKNVRVLLMDSQMGTGAAAMMAIRVLLDHGVPESNIIFLTFLIARRGHLSVHRAFPQVRIVTAAIDPGLQEMHFPLNGLLMGEAAGEGDFGVRLIGDERPGAVDDGDEDEGESGGEGRAQVNEKEEEMRRLQFSRTKRESVSVTEKRAWVVSPGMGHIGDRYYTL